MPSFTPCPQYPMAKAVEALTAASCHGALTAVPGVDGLWPVELPYSGVSQLAFAASSCDGLVATTPGSPGYWLVHDDCCALAVEPVTTSDDKQTVSVAYAITPGLCRHLVTTPSRRRGRSLVCI